MPVCNRPDRGSRFALTRKRAHLLQVRRRKAFANFNMALRVVCPQGQTFAQWVSSLEKVWQHSEVPRHNALRLQANPWTGTSSIGDWFKCSSGKCRCALRRRKWTRTIDGSNDSREALFDHGRPGHWRPNKLPKTKGSGRVASTANSGRHRRPNGTRCVEWVNRDIGPSHCAESGSRNRTGKNVR